MCSLDRSATRTPLLWTTAPESQFRCDRSRFPGCRRLSGYRGRPNGMFGSPALNPRNLHSPEPSISVELSPCTSGYSGGLSLVTTEELGEVVLGDVCGWQARMVVEGSRSRTIILRITQRLYLTFGESYWIYTLSTTLHPHRIVMPILDVRKRPCTPGQVQR